MSNSTATIALVLTAKDLASKEVNKLGASFRNLKSGALDGVGLGMIGVAGAATALTAALIDGVRGAIEEEQSIARLNTVLKQNIPAWDGNTSAIDRATAAAQDLGFSDDAVRDSLTKLVPATHDLNEALRVQRIAMDLARLKGISLVDASQALTKVEGGQYRALKELGIVLKDGATQTDALAAVQRVAMGQAAAYTDTLAGKTEVLSVRFDELKEKVGTLAMPGLTDLANRLIDATDAMDPDKPQSFTDRLGGLVGLLKNAGPVIATTWMLVEKLTGQTQDAGSAANVTDGQFQDLRGEFVKGREASKRYAQGLVPTINGLSLTGQAALDAVNYMIDLRREMEFLQDNGRGNGTPRPQVGQQQTGKGIKKKKKADGGWVGLNGPEVAQVGERGPEYVVPAHALLRAQNKPVSGVTIQGVSEKQIMDMIDRGLYFRLQRAGASV